MAIIYATYTLINLNSPTIKLQLCLVFIMVVTETIALFDNQSVSLINLAS